MVKNLIFFPEYQKQDKDIHSQHIFKHGSQGSISAFRQEKEIKGIQIGNGVRLSTGNIIFYVENPMEST